MDARRGCGCIEGTVLGMGESDSVGVAGGDGGRRDSSDRSSPTGPLSRVRINTATVDGWTVMRLDLAV